MLKKKRLFYRVVKGKNPRNGKEILRPVIAKREVCGINEIVERMMRGGWTGRGASLIRGDIEDIFKIIRELCLEGKVVTIADWLCLRGDLTGTVKEDHALTKDNEYHLSAKILGQNHIPMDKFSWSDVSHDEAQAKLYIARFRSIGETSNRLVRGKQFMVTGTQTLSGPKDWFGQLSWKTPEGETRSIPADIQEGHPGRWTFNWSPELDALPDGTEITYSVTCITGRAGHEVERYGEATATLAS